MVKNITLKKEIPCIAHRREKVKKRGRKNEIKWGKCVKDMPISRKDNFISQLPDISKIRTMLVREEARFEPKPEQDHYTGRLNLKNSARKEKNLIERLKKYEEWI